MSKKGVLTICKQGCSQLPDGARSYHVQRYRHLRCSSYLVMLIVAGGARSYLKKWVHAATQEGGCTQLPSLISEWVHAATQGARSYPQRSPRGRGALGYPRGARSYPLPCHNLHTIANHTGETKACPGNWAARSNLCRAIGRPGTM